MILCRSAVRARVLRHPAGEGERGGIEETPTGFLSPPVVAWLFPLLEARSANLLHADDLAPVHLHDCLVRAIVSERRRPIVFRAADAVVSRWIARRLDDLSDEAGKVAA